MSEELATWLYAAAAIVIAVVLFALNWRLALAPAPALRRASLRQMARALLVPKRSTRWALVWREWRSNHRWLLALAYPILFAVVLLPLPADVLGLQIPFPLDYAPFNNRRESEDYLQTMWQVVAAALALSVAMVAFAFEAFMSTAQRVHGGTLREFAAETRLVQAIRLGALALLVDGAVLLGVGHDAPAGWAAVWAITLSAATLLAVPGVVTLVLRSLDSHALLEMREIRLNRAVEAALHHQLLGQAADVVLRRRQNEFFVERRLWAPQGAVAITPDREAEVHDVRLGPLARLSVEAQLTGHAIETSVVVELGDRVGTNRTLASVAAGTPERLRKRVKRAIRIRPVDPDRPDRRFLDQLAQLHAQARTAITSGQADDWRRIGDLYELVLLALPKAAAQLGVPFAGAVAAPGPFGFGPLQRIRDYLYDEMSLAVETNQFELVDPISYMPLRIAREAHALGAHDVANTMLGLYPAMYYMAHSKS